MTDKIDCSMADEVLVEIDGERIDYDGRLEWSFFDNGNGGVSGADWSIINDVRCAKPFGMVYFLAISGHDENGKYWGMDAVFKHGEWLTDEETGKPVYSVSERLA